MLYSSSSFFVALLCISVYCAVYMMLVVPIGSVADYMQLACERVHDVAGNSDVGGHQRMVSDEVDGLFDRCIGFFKSVEPSREVYAAVFHERDVFLRLRLSPS